MNSWNDVCNKDDSQANPRRIPRAKLEPRSIRRAQILHEHLVGDLPAVGGYYSRRWRSSIDADDDHGGQGYHFRLSQERSQE